VISPPEPGLRPTGRVLQLNYASVMANMDGTSEASGSEIQAVDRVGQICSLFGPHTTELTAADVAERLGLNRTTAYRYCASMVSAGILERGPRRSTFVLGGLMLQLGIHALSRRRVTEIAPPHLAELSAAVRMTAVLSLWGARGPIVTLVEEDRTRSAVVTVRAGTQLDATAAQTRVFLAHLTDARAFDWTAAGSTTAQRAELEAAVYTARRSGYCIASQSGGVFTAAAPVFDEYGIAATVGLLGADPQADLTPDSPIIRALLRTTTVLSNELRGRPDGPTDDHSEL
jgi:DNA-binding IclR family transcriptional regulator